MVDKKVSIYQAEIHYKYKVNENQLTSRVFGALAMLPRDTVLLPFLNELAKGKAALDETDPVSGIQSWESKDVESAEISLWRYIDATCPDICIETPSTLIVIEAKTDTEPDKDRQLKPQFREAYDKANATERKRKLAYFLLTRDDQSKVAQDAQKELRREGYRDARVHWRSWTQVWQWLREIRKGLQGKTSIGNTSLHLLDATINLLEGRHMNIKGPTGFKEKWFRRDVINVLDEVEELCFEIRNTIDKVISEAKLKGIEVVGETPHPKSVTRNLKNSSEWIPRYFEFYFKDESWKRVEDPGKDPNLLISFGLAGDGSGISVSLYWHDPDLEDAINEIKKNAEATGFRFEYDDEDLYISGDLEIKDLEEGKRAVEVLVKKLVEMRDFANEQESLREVLGRKLRKRNK